MIKSFMVTIDCPAAHFSMQSSELVDYIAEAVAHSYGQTDLACSVWETMTHAETTVQGGGICRVAHGYERRVAHEKRKRDQAQAQAAHAQAQASQAQQLLAIATAITEDLDRPY